jgi:Flp pilus assembly protein TadD
MKHETPHSRQQVLVARARRAVSRGEKRQAMVALREACFLMENDARLWALYGNACARLNRKDDAERAFTQALYLRQREQDTARARVLREILERLQIERAA